jgi:hypothetical protein
MSTVPKVFELLADLETEIDALHVLHEVSIDSGASLAHVVANLHYSLESRIESLRSVVGELYAEYFAAKKAEGSE